MEMLTAIWVGKPWNILIMSLALFVVCMILRFAAPANRQRFGALLVASAAWGAYAAWEWFVQAKTPEANIRVDLLFIWPILTILTAWAFYRLLRPQ
jgi:hypothetical protein